MAQPRSQRPETEVFPRRATDAKAEVRSPTATKSGSLIQSTKAHLRLAFYFWSQCQLQLESVISENPR